MITADDLRTISPSTGARASVYATLLDTAMDRFHINTVTRIAAFLAQVLHESGSLRWTREIASGIAYEGRLGNTQPGDGERFAGRGLIQVTGRANYEACGKGLGLDLIATPELLERPDYAALSAAWWWWAHGCNELADSGDFVKLTRKINGGVNGLAERQALWARARAVLEPPGQSLPE